MLAANETQELKLDGTQAGATLVGLPTKRELIEDALRTDSNRSDREIAREIARIVGCCDHKTVGTARERLGIAKSPVGKSPESIAAPYVAAALATIQPAKEKKFNPFDPDDGCLVAPERLGLACFVNTRDNIVIANGNARDGIDEMVQINPIDLDGLISRLREIQSEISDGVYLRDDAAAGGS